MEKWENSRWVSASTDHLDSRKSLRFCIKWLIEKGIADSGEIPQLKGLTIEELLGAMLAAYRELGQITE